MMKKLLVYLLLSLGIFGEVTLEALRDMYEWSAKQEESGEAIGDYIGYLEKNLYMIHEIDGLLLRIEEVGGDISKLEEPEQDYHRYVTNTGIDMDFTGEGIVDLRVNYEVILRDYSHRLTYAQRGYYELLAMDNEVRALDDFAVVVEKTEFLDRLKAYRDYINQYPRSNYIEDVISLYDIYLYISIYGIDNTPIFSEGMLDYTWVTAYEEFYLENAQNQLGKDLKFLAESYRNMDGVYRVEVKGLQDNIYNKHRIKGI